MCEENYEDDIYESEKFINIENVDDIKKEVITFFIQLGKYFENEHVRFYIHHRQQAVNVQGESY
jgi:3-methyladenine DNA glycosylase AlkC